VLAYYENNAVEKIVIVAIGCWYFTNRYCWKWLSTQNQHL